MKETEPYDGLTNGKVTITIEICDPIGKLGIMTSMTEFDSEKSYVTDELAEHLEWEHGIDVSDFDLEVVE